MGIYDISNPSEPKRIAFLNTSGPYSRGVHCLWFVDGEYAHLSTGAADFQPRNQLDDQFYMIVDVHNTNVYPQRPDRAYAGWLDSGFIILDVSDMSRPKMISQIDHHPPFAGFT